VNIQIFYQKDFQDLVFKYGLRMSGAAPAKREVVKEQKTAS